MRDFSLDIYRALLETLQTKGYRLISYAEYLKGQRDNVQGTKEEEKPQETVIKTVYKLEGEDERLKQLIDIALLASGQLKGEALARFVNRSVELL